MNQMKSFYTTVSATVILLSMTACSVASKKPLNADELAVDILSNSDVQITQVVAKQNENSILVDGQVRRKVAGGRGVIKGHVDVTLKNREGQPIRQVVAECAPRIIPSRGTLTSSFNAQIPLIAPQDSLVSLRFHNGPHDG